MRFFYDENEYAQDAETRDNRFQKTARLWEE
jgi:hypothetical protein